MRVSTSLVIKMLYYRMYVPMHVVNCGYFNVTDIPILFSSKDNFFHTILLLNS